MRKYCDPVARGLIALIFIVSGFGKLMAFDQTVSMMESVGFPLPAFFVVGAIVIEVIGGAALLLGYKAHWAGLVLFLFLIPTTVIFHLRHIHDPEQGQTQMIQVMKNLAIMGGLLKFYLTGAGACALDNLLARRRTAAAEQAAS
jgi:putative oxidoreductase